MPTLIRILTLASGVFLSWNAIANDPQAGQAKAVSCVVCHGPLGISINPGAPNLAGQPAVYLLEQLHDYKSGRRKNPVMSVIAQPLSEKDIQDLAAWYSSIEIQLKPK